MDHSRVKWKHLCDILPSLDTAVPRESRLVETDTEIFFWARSFNVLDGKQGKEMGLRITAEESQPNQEYVIFMDNVADAGAFSGSRFKKREKMGKKGSPEALFDDYFSRWTIF